MVKHFRIGDLERIFFESKGKKSRHNIYFRHEFSVFVDQSFSVQIARPEFHPGIFGAGITKGNLMKLPPRNNGPAAGAERSYVKIVDIKPFAGANQGTSSTTNRIGCRLKQ